MAIILYLDTKTSYYDLFRLVENCIAGEGGDGCVLLLSDNYQNLDTQYLLCKHHCFADFRFSNHQRIVDLAHECVIYTDNSNENIVIQSDTHTFDKLLANFYEYIIYHKS